MAKKKKKKLATWKELKQIAERNALKMENQPSEFLEKTIKPYQQVVYSIVEDMVNSMETEGGIIRKNTKNLSLINKIDNEIELLKMTAGHSVVSDLMKRISGTLKDNFDYYGRMLGRGQDFRQVKESVEDEVNKRYGIRKDGSLSYTGFIYGLLNDQTVKNTVTQKLYTAVYSNSKVNDVLLEAKAYLNGHKGRRGAVEDFYSKFASDVFSHADRMSSRAFGKKYGLKWFIYAGTIVKNSRAFCRGKIGGVYNTEDAKKWIDEKPGPLGISPESYSPIIHMGGINCIHCPFFITDGIRKQYENMLKSRK